MSFLLKKKQDVLLHELNRRHNHLLGLLSGRPAVYPQDSYHDLPRGSYTQETVEKHVIVDSLELRLAVSDFESILKELKKL